MPVCTVADRSARKIARVRLTLAEWRGLRPDSEGLYLVGDLPRPEARRLYGLGLSPISRVILVPVLSIDEEPRRA